MEWFFWSLLACCSFGTLLGTAHLFWFLRPPSNAPEEWPFLSVIKPLKGIDAGLQQNLHTLFQQDYPRFEILFGVEGHEDPVIDLVHSVASHYPDVSYRMVIHDGNRGLNPKVANIRAIWETGVQEIVVLNDSNIAVRPMYLQEMARPFCKDPNIGLVSSIFVGSGEKTFWAFMENMYINGPLANMLAAYQSLTQEALVVGKSNAFRSQLLDALGGFESLAYVLAEDYHMGKMMRYAGYQVVFCSQACFNQNLHTTLPVLWNRYVRWGLIRSRLTPLLYPLEALLNPLCLGFLVFAFLGRWEVFVWYFALVSIRDGLQWAKLRGREHLGWVLLSGWMRDLLYTLIWFAAPFYRSVSWRGNRLSVGIGTHLFVQKKAVLQPSEVPTSRKI
ncbi:MAG: glycosyltransferase [Myxococcales bacterium]|nr:glycosyltransferase [Myxococcales bacterium]MCB9644628.1 glycosyltransferase [Myxococcales bacterium]